MNSLIPLFPTEKLKAHYCNPYTDRMSYERILIESFVIKERQQRYLNLIRTEKGRKKLRQYIPHFKDLNPKYIQPVNNLQSAAELHALIKSKKAPTHCYIISEHSNYDGRYLTLQTAIEELFNSGISYFVCAIPENLNVLTSI